MAHTDESFKIDQTLLERAATLLKLRYKENQRLLTGRDINNLSGGHDIINMFKEGKMKRTITININAMNF